MEDIIDEFNRKINTLVENDPVLEYVVYKTLGNYNGTFHILFMYELNIKGKYLKKLYEKCCNNNIYIFFLTLNMIEKATFSIFEIFENLNLDEPICFVDEIKDEILEPMFFNRLNEHKDFLKKKKKIFKEKLMTKLNEKSKKI